MSFFCAVSPDSRSPGRPASPVLVTVQLLGAANAASREECLIVGRRQVVGRPDAERKICSPREGTLASFCPSPIFLTTRSFSGSKGSVVH